MAIETVPGKKNVQRVSPALYKIIVKVLNEAGKVKLLYGYETKDLMQMLCLKHLNKYLFSEKEKKYIKGTGAFEK